MRPTSAPRTRPTPDGVLHLIDPLRAGSLAVGALAACVAPGDAVVCLGPRDAARSLADWGLRPDARAPAPCAHPALAGGALRAALRALPPMRRWRAWSSRSMLAGARAQRAAPGVELSATIFDPPALGDPLGALIRRALVSGRVRARFASAHVGCAWGCGLTDPAPALAPPVSPLDRAERRAAWGAGPDDVVLGALTDPPFALEAGRATFLVGVLAIAGAPVRGVIPGDARGAERAFRMVDRQGARWGAAFESAAPPRWLHACDAVIAFAPTLAPEATGEPPLCARWALDAGVPCVAESSGPAPAPVDGRPALRVVAPGEMRSAAAALATIFGCVARPVGAPEGARPRRIDRQRSLVGLA